MLEKARLLEIAEPLPVICKNFLGDDVQS